MFRNVLFGFATSTSPNWERESNGEEMLREQISKLMKTKKCPRNLQYNGLVSGEASRRSGFKNELIVISNVLFRQGPCEK